MKPESDQTLPKIGYLYHYPSLDHPTAKFRLDIFVSDTPTQEHFDVLHVLLDVESEYGGFEKLKITHPWEYQSPYRICPGLVILEDRHGKKEEAFCFGGQLTINRKKTLTECFLVSPAPIIEITENDRLKVLLIEKVEILLAEYRAAYGNDREYEKDLCAADPLDLYTACLDYFKEKIKSKTQHNELDLQFLIYLRKEAYRLRTTGLITDKRPELAAILKK